MFEIPLSHSHDHLLVYPGPSRRPWILDTGSPTTFGVEALSWGGEVRHVPDNMLGFRAEELPGLQGFDAAGLIGNDVLGADTFEIDVAAGRLVIGAEPEDGVEIFEVPGAGGPVLPCRIGGKALRAIFDSGAQIGYASGLVPEAGEKPEGMLTDFHPLVGRYETPIYRRTVEVGEARVEMRFGELHEGLRNMMAFAAQAFDFDAVLSCELATVARIGIDLQGERGWIVPN